MSWYGERGKVPVVGSQELIGQRAKNGVKNRAAENYKPCQRVGVDSPSRLLTFSASRKISEGGL